MGGHPFGFGTEWHCRAVDLGTAGWAVALLVRCPPLCSSAAPPAERLPRRSVKAPRAPGPDHAGPWGGPAPGPCPSACHPLTVQPAPGCCRGRSTWTSFQSIRPTLHSPPGQPAERPLPVPPGLSPDGSEPGPSGGPQALALAGADLLALTQGPPGAPPTSVRGLGGWLLAQGGSTQPPRVCHSQDSDTCSLG